MKKVLLIAPYAYLPWFSGGQKFIAQFTEHLGQVTDLTVISVPANRPEGPLSYKWLPWLRAGRSRYIDLSLIRKLSALIRNGKFDTLIIEHPYLAWLAERLKKKTGIRVLIHTHNIEHQRFRSLGKWWWPILRLYERRAFQRADKLLFISNEDQAFAVSAWHVDPQKCIALPFGVETTAMPADKKECRLLLEEKHRIRPEEKILLFSGWLQYPPNLQALREILESINPLLLGADGFRYKIIVCGKGLPAHFNGLQDYRNLNIIYAGFVPDIVPYFKGADLLLNPVAGGGGVKTKMIEAIAYGTTVIATEKGAMGISPSICGDKLVVINDNDWPKFAVAVQERSQREDPTPASFYETFSWPSLIRRFVKSLV